MRRTDPDDYMALTPGPKCYNYTELETELYNCIVKNMDNYAEDRERIRNFVYDFPNGQSCAHIWEYLRKEVIKI